MSSTKCPKCGSSELLVESKPNGDKRLKCSECGLDNVYDREGRLLLTGDGDSPNVGELLTEG